MNVFGDSIHQGAPMIYDIQKASLTKRLSAFLFDFVLMTILVTGFMLLLSTILGYDGYSQSLQDRLISINEKHHISELEEKYKDSEEYVVDFQQYQYMLEEERAALPEEVRTAFNACLDEINKDEEAIRLYATIMNLSLVILSCSILLSYLVLEFAVPLALKNGQTIGKKIFSIALMRSDCVKISPMVLFIRTVLGKYTISTMVPALMLLMLLFGAAPIMPLAVILLILFLQVVIMITSKTNSLIHDSLASTVVVDLQSQMIFDSPEALNEYKLRLHREDAEKAEY